MQESTSDPLDLNKKQAHNGQYDAPPSLDGRMWDQVQEQAKVKQQLQLIPNPKNQNN